MAVICKLLPCICIQLVKVQNVGDLLFARIQNLIISHLAHKEFKKESEISGYLMSFSTIAVSSLIHIYLLILYFSFGNMLFVAMNSLSLLLYVFVLLQINEGKYSFAGILISLEVLVYATLQGILLGIGFYSISYFLLGIILQLVLPYKSNHIQFIMTVMPLIVVLFCIILDASRPVPMVVLDSKLSYILTISNIYLMLIGAIVQLYINNIIKVVIKRFNDTKISELSTQIYTDSLTGLFNRRYAESEFSAMSSSDSDISYTVAMIDIDDFKKVNDTYGHPVGDEVLIFLSNFLLKSLRKTDVIFRWGGEEFLIILENANSSVAYIVLEKIRKDIAKSIIPTAGGDLKITITIGAANFDVDDPQKSIKESDDNLYKGKHSTKNVVVIS